MSLYSERVLIFAPSENDAAVAERVLKSAGFQPLACSGFVSLVEEIGNGVGAVMLADEAMTAFEGQALRFRLSTQPPWSDLPILILGRVNRTSAVELFGQDANVSILERPFSQSTFIQAVSVALRARRRQYEVRDLIVEQQQATQKRDDFLATLSHELRTPLNVILGWIDMIGSESPREGLSQTAVEILKRNALMQKSLIDDLLDISRIVTGKLHFEPSALSLSQLTAQVCEGFAPRCAEKQIELKVELLSEKAVVFADEARLTQVISNLMTNAIKFTDEGGSIEVFLSLVGTRWCLSVKDSGQGIEPDFLPFVFDRLKQEDMSTTRKHGGLGLGLAICAHIVEQHAGKISCTSAGRGKGAQFVVQIPAHNAEIPKVDSLATASDAEISLAGIKVLLVDDSVDLRELIQFWLLKSGASVRLAASADEALNLLKSYQPNVILSDIGMPDKDGYQFIEELRSHADKKINSIPAIALTAYARDEERSRALAAGFQRHIAKPISRNVLVPAVHSLFRSPG